MFRSFFTLLALAATLSAATIDPAVMKTGQQQFMICGACHGQNAEGTPAAPPLAGSEWVSGPQENLIRIQLRGLQGAIKVKGQDYNIPGGMQPLAYQSDDQIAAVLTYVRNSFGNSAPPVTAAAVTALRGEAGKPQLTAAELTAPVETTAGGNTPPAAANASGKYANLAPESSLPRWIALGIALLIIGFLLTMFKKSKGNPND